MEEKNKIEIGQSVEHMTEEERKQIRLSVNPDEMGFDGREGEEE